MNEKEAIERLNRFKTIKVLYGNTFAIHLEQLEQLQNDIETVLNLLEKQKAEISDLKWKNEIYVKSIKSHDRYEIELNDEIIEKNNKIFELEAKIEKKDKESHFIQSELDIANAKIIKLNKMIDLMAEYINDIDVTEDLCEEVVCEEQNECKECIKQHFENEVNKIE